MMTTAKPAGMENMLHMLMYTTITNKLQSAANTDLDTNMQTYTHNHAHSVGIETHTHTRAHTHCEKWCAKTAHLGVLFACLQ